MESTSLILILRSFTKAELKRFGLFIQSPYFNKEKVLMKFTQILSENYPAFKITKEEAFQKLYPGKKYSDSFMRNIISDLLKHCEKFLAVNGLDKYQAKKKFLSELNKRNLNTLYLKNHLHLTKSISEFKFKNAEYFKELYEDLSEKNLNILRSSDRYLKKTEYEEILKNLSLYFLINLLKHSSSEINARKYIRKSADYFKNENLPGDLIENYFKEYEGITYVKIYYCIYKILKDDSEKHFKILKKFVEDKADEIKDEDLSNIYSALSNFAYMKVISGDTGYTKEQFEISLNSIRKKLYKEEKGFLPHVSYLNVVITGLEVNRVTEVSEFIDEFSSELNDSYRDSTVNLAMALISYKLKDYDEALNQLNKVNIEDYSFRQQIRSLYLKIYFDLNESEPFYFHVDRYKHFIGENKSIHESLKKNLNGYIFYTKKLFDIKNLINKEEMAVQIDILKMELEKNSSVLNKNWLNEKMKDLI